MAEETTPISPLDPLGPEFGRIDLPRIDEQGLSPFEGDKMNVPTFQPENPEFIQPSILPHRTQLVSPNQNIRAYVAPNAPQKTPAQNALAKYGSVEDRAFATQDYVSAKMQEISVAPKDRKQKMFSYYDAPDGHMFYKRYAAYGQEEFDRIGLNIFRDNDAVYNQNTTGFQDFKRMMTNSFVPLFSRGFVSGPKSLMKMMQGDFSSDPADAEAYAEAAAIGQSTKGGIGAFVGNTMMNFGYTAGIITEAVMEEVAGVFLAPETGGASFFAATANNLRKIPAVFKGLRGIDKVKDVAQALKSSSSAAGARRLWEATKANTAAAATSKVGRFFNPLENTVDALIGVGKNADNLTGMAKTMHGMYKTAGGLYRDTRAINMAISEARLEGGMQQNDVYNELVTDYWNANGEAPDARLQKEFYEQAKMAGAEVLAWNTALIFASNKIVIPNIVGPRGGIASFLRSKTDDIINLDSSVGKVVFEKVKAKAAKAGEKISKISKGEFKFVEASFKQTMKDIVKSPFKKGLVAFGGYFRANIMEGFQENLQETMSDGFKKYYVDQFESNAVRSHMFNKAATYEGIRSKYDYLGDAWKEQNPFTAKGFETFASGFFMGMLASPLNKSIEFASKQYNKNFNKEEYDKYMNAKTNYAKSVVNQLNSLYSDPAQFFNSKIFNYGAQDRASIIKQYGSRKEALDATDEALSSQLTTAIQTGNLGLFKEHIAEYKNLTPEEFEEAVGIEKGQGAKYQAKIDDILKTADEIETEYKDIDARYPDPIDLSKYNKGTDEYKKAAIYNATWQQAKRNAVFMNRSFKNARVRMQAIAQKLSTEKPLANMTASEMEVLTNVSRMKNERDMLKTEIGAEGQTASKFDLANVKKKQNKLDALDEFIDAYEYYQNYEVYDIEEQLDEYGNQGLFKDVKDNEGNVLSEEDARGEAKKLLLAKLKVPEKSKEASLKAKTNLESAYKNYLKSVAGLRDDTYFEENADKAFALLLDHYSLGRESNLMAEYVNILYNPKGFGEHVERNYQWMTDLYDNRKDYYESMVNQELTHIELNAILNSLAARDIYVSQEDAINFLRNPNQLPTEFFDNSRKAVIKEGHPEFEDLRFHFVMAASAAKKDLKTPTNEELDRNLAYLEEAMEDEIDGLPKVSKRTEVGELDLMGAASVTIDAVMDQLAVNQYIEVSYTFEDNGKTKYGKQFFYKDKEGNLRYNDEKGTVLDTTTITQPFTKGTIYRMDLAPADEEAVNAIKEKYAQKRIDLINKMSSKVNTGAAEDAQNKFIPFTNMTPVNDMENELQELLQSGFNQYLENNPDVQERVIDLDEYAFMEEFESFVRTNKIAKDVIEKYNKKRVAEEAVKPTGQVDAPIIEINGQLIDFGTLTDGQVKTKVKQLEKQVAQIEADINALPEDKRTAPEFERLAKMKFNLALAEKYMAYKSKTTRSPKMESVQSIIEQRIIKYQESITKDDARNKYVIDNDLFERVTTAIEKLKKDAYNYKSMDAVLAAFNMTIGSGGTVDQFISKLKERLPAGTDGMSNFVFKSLKRELNKLITTTTTNTLEVNTAGPKLGFKTFNVPISKKEDIANVVAGPLVPASEIFWDKNIRTTGSWIEVIQGKATGEDYIEIAYDSLSEENKKIADKLKESDTNFGGFKGVRIVLGNNLSAEEAQSKAIEIANKFKQQDLLWYSPVTLQNTINSLEADKKRFPNSAKEIDQEIERVKDTWGKELSAGEYFDKATQTIWASKELYNKSKGVSTLDIEAQRADIEKRRMADIKEYYKQDFTGKTKSIQELEKELQDINAKYDAELAALGTSSKAKLSMEELRNNLKSFINEFTYEENRKAGNYFDKQIRNFLTTGEAEFDAGSVTQEAFDAIFGPNSLMAKLKTRQDNGEIKIYADNIKLFDKDSKIAGEVDLLIVDREGNVFIVDIKTGNKDKWDGFNNAKNPYSKKESYLLQQTAYANMFYNMTGIMPKVSILPIEIESELDMDINEETGEITGGKVLTADIATSALNLGESLIELDPETIFGDGKESVQQRVDTLIPRKDIVEEEQPEVLGDVSDEEYNSFVDNKYVSDERINDIAYKISKGLPLTDREESMRQEVNAQVNAKLLEIAKENEQNAGLGSDEESPKENAEAKVIDKALSEDEQKSRENNVAVINRRIDILKDRLLATDRDLDKLKDKLQFIQDMLDSSVELAGVNVESLMMSAEGMLLLAQKLEKAKQNQRGRKIKGRVDQNRAQIKKELKEAQFLLNTINKVKEDIRQMEEIKLDLQRHINYYNQLKNDPSLRTINKTELNSKIEKIKKKISTIERLINILTNAIRKSLSYLREYIKIFGKHNTKLAAFKADTGYNELSPEQLRELINSTDPNDTQLLENYPQLKKQFDQLAVDINKSMDDIEFTEEVLEAERKRQEELVNALSKYDRELRYLYDLLEPIADEAMFDNKVNDARQSNAPTPQSPGPTQRIQERIKENEKELSEAEKDMGETIGTFSLSDVEETENDMGETISTFSLTDMEETPSAITEDYKSIVEKIKSVNEPQELYSLFSNLDVTTLTTGEIDLIQKMYDEKLESLKNGTAEIILNENNIKKDAQLTVKNAIFINNTLWAEQGSVLVIEDVTDGVVTASKINDGNSEKLTFEQLNSMTMLKENTENAVLVEPVVLDQDDKDNVETSIKVANSLTDEDIENIQNNIKDKSLDQLKNNLFNTKLCD